MDIDTIYPSKYIKSSDLVGREVAVKIERYEIETVGEDRKLVLYFQGKRKGLVTNKTNAGRIAHYYGKNTDAWIGREIVLYTDLVTFQGKNTEAIRVKVQLPTTSVIDKKGGYDLHRRTVQDVPAPAVDASFADDDTGGVEIEDTF